MVHQGIQRVKPQRGARVIHVETPLGIVNIHLGLEDRHGRRVENVQMQPNDYAGELPVRTIGNRFVELKKRPRSGVSQ